MLGIFDRVSVACAKRIQSVAKTMPKLVLVEVTKTNPKPIEKDHTFIVLNSKNRREMQSKRIENCLFETSIRRKILYATVQDIPL